MEAELTINNLAIKNLVRLKL